MPDPKASIDALRTACDDLQVMLETAVEHGDAIESQLSEANAQLAGEIRERRRAEARMEALVRALREKVRDYEVLVEILSEHADSIDVLHHEQISSLEGEAMSDPLTGLANRRALDRALKLQWSERDLNAGGLSVLLVDVDFFKLFNDTQGHQAGDECLRAVAEAMKHTLSRPEDVIARYGGEEFSVILPGTSEEGAAIVAQRMIGAVNALNIAHPKSPLGFVTVSIGGASYWPLRDTAELASMQDLQARADAALYTAKQRGRNRYCVLEKTK
jgi:diguanylate cyclase (GGDEF)-like protein